MDNKPITKKKIIDNQIITKNQYIKQKVDLGTTTYNDARLQALMAEFNYLLMNKIINFNEADIEMHTSYPHSVAGEFCVKLKDAGYGVSLTPNRIHIENRDSHTESWIIESGYDIRVIVD
jgi:hypothetical protein